MIKVVIFDIDGTLVDSVDLHARAWQEAFEQFGREVSFEKVRMQIGKGGDQLLPVFFSADELKRFGIELERRRGELFKEKHLPQVRAFPKVRELFRLILAKGQRILLASSAQGDELEAYKRIARVDDLIETDTSADDVEHSKPHPDVFQAALSKAGDVSVNDAIVVGDTPYDAQAAGKIGLRTVGLLCGGFPEADLRASGCVEIYRDPAELLACYAESPLAS